MSKAVAGVTVALNGASGDSKRSALDEGGSRVPVWHRKAALAADTPGRATTGTSLLLAPRQRALHQADCPRTRRPWPDQRLSKSAAGTNADRSRSADSGRSKVLGGPRRATYLVSAGLKRLLALFRPGDPAALLVTRQLRRVAERATAPFHVGRPPEDVERQKVGLRRLAALAFRPLLSRSAGVPRRLLPFWGGACLQTARFQATRHDRFKRRRRRSSRCSAERQTESGRNERAGRGDACCKGFWASVCRGLLRERRGAGRTRARQPAASTR